MSIYCYKLALENIKTLFLYMDLLLYLVPTLQMILCVRVMAGNHIGDAFPKKKLKKIEC